MVSIDESCNRIMLVIIILQEIHYMKNIVIFRIETTLMFENIKISWKSCFSLKSEHVTRQNTLRLGLCNIQFQSADRNPWQNISWKVNSCWTWLCTTSLSPVRSDWPIVQSSFPAKSLFPAISSSCSIIPCHVSLFPATFPATSSILPAASVYLPPPQCPLVSLDTWKQMTDRISDWTIGFRQETSVQSELRLDCPTRDWSDRPIEKLGSMRFYTVIGSYKVPIGRINSSIEHMGLTPIRSDPSIGPTKSQPKRRQFQSEWLQCKNRISLHKGVYAHEGH